MNPVNARAGVVFALCIIGLKTRCQAVFSQKKVRQNMIGQWRHLSRIRRIGK